MKTCANCRFWEPEIPDDPDIENGLCRIDPPKLRASSTQGKWPWTTRADWCGRHVPRRVEFGK